MSETGIKFCPRTLLTASIYGCTCPVMEWTFDNWFNQITRCLKSGSHIQPIDNIIVIQQEFQYIITVPTNRSEFNVLEHSFSMINNLDYINNGCIHLTVPYLVQYDILLLFLFVFQCPESDQFNDSVHECPRMLYDASLPKIKDYMSTSIQSHGA
ncbi:hypothetical protein DFJ58DRAFT_846292 [Suillus subalutaceus]|uniref:uncharacterized protein n=1 Tax=Suillus subalutaceus TaxID=48586 RepID=UPI001B86A69A|nr:uncharacterized protein DFJ58DRAFT_846292 [Suillus subalutaceus]KAG1837834.1 hypothetical protein DFJ58DRAFT_846292 [Suillus subalutaceus]